MNRLTAINSEGDVLRTNSTISDRDAWYRLSEYEDTNIEPYQIELIQEDNKQLQRHNKEYREEILKLRADRDYWELEAKKAVAKLGEIQILMKGV